MKEICHNYKKGKCRWGRQCRFEHRRPIQLFLLRHVQSFFNKKLDELTDDFTSELAKNTIHFDLDLIDCPITPEGRAQTESLEVPKDCFIIFVSPLERALETAKILMSRCPWIIEAIVIPELTEIVSKICDFSKSIAEKRQRYPEFNFKRFDIYQEIEVWQYGLIEEKFHEEIENKTEGLQFVSILKKIFPAKLESKKHCSRRSFYALNIVLEMAKERQCKSAVIVSHNRILCEISTLVINEYLPFKNGEIRMIEA